MGLLQDGLWVDKWYDTKATNGRFERTAPQFRNWITLDGEPGPTGDSGFLAQADRYHLYISFACPWAHRTLIFRILKGLEDMVSLSVVNSYMGEQGWTFEPADGVIPDMVNDATKLHQVYTRAEKNYSGRVTVPVLWDRKKNTIVSNESSEIIRMFNSAFNGLGATPNDFYPVDIRDEIDDLNDRIYRNVNNGVYKAGFATSQEAYDDAIASLFETLDWLEKRLSRQRYLTGRVLT
ncbi:MAG: Glutathionyl-hydroquinone reductase YqjG, partial [Alphaproteobacteria bacterium MarineAlpha3_Bin5]